MITHVVLFRFHDNARERIDEAAAAFRALENTIGELVSVRSGRNVLPSDRAYDLCLLIEVRSLDDLAAYRAHPDHHAVAAWVDECSASTISVDFESGSLTAEPSP